MSQGTFNFKYSQSKSESGLTSYAGVGIYFDLFWKLQFHDVVDSLVSSNHSEQGWPYWHQIISLILLNLLGGESIDDIEVLENDEGLCRLMRRYEKSLSKRSRSDFHNRFRKGRSRTFPSSSALRRFLNRFSITTPSSLPPGAYVSKLSRNHEWLTDLQDGPGLKVGEGFSIMGICLKK